MKNLLRLLIITAATAAAQGGTSPARQYPTGLILGDPVWAYVPVSYTPGNPFAGGGRRSYYARYPDAGRPEHVRRAVADARARFGGGRGPAHLPPWRAASVELTNSGPKEIRRVRLDFVFTDEQSGAEVLRLSLRSGKRLRAGETALLMKEVKGSAKNRRGDGARLSVELKEVVYADGSLWRAGA